MIVVACLGDFGYMAKNKACLLDQIQRHVEGGHVVNLGHRYSIILAGVAGVEPAAGRIWSSAHAHALTPIGTGAESRTQSSRFTGGPLLAVEHHQHNW